MEREFPENNPGDHGHHGSGKGSSSMIPAMSPLSGTPENVEFSYNNFFHIE
jgi:hypothetical protein